RRRWRGTSGCLDLHSAASGHGGCGGPVRRAPRSARSRPEEIRRPGLFGAGEGERAARRATHRTRHAVSRYRPVEGAFAGQLEVDVVATDAHALERHEVVAGAEPAIPDAA